MKRAAYDVYADLHVTHVEIGYLLAIAVALAFLDLAAALALALWPAADVYLAPGVTERRVVAVQWGAPAPPPVPPAPAHPPVPLALPAATLLSASVAALDLGAPSTSPALDATAAAVPAP